MSGFLEQSRQIGTIRKHLSVILLLINLISAHGFVVPLQWLLERRCMRWILPRVLTKRRRSCAAMCGSAWSSRHPLAAASLQRCVQCKQQRGKPWSTGFEFRSCLRCQHLWYSRYALDSFKGSARSLFIDVTRHLFRFFPPYFDVFCVC